MIEIEQVKEIVDELYASNFVNHDPDAPEARDLESYKQSVAGIFTAFPDFHVTIEDMVAEGDKIAVRWTVRGTQKGEFKGIAPTGKQVTCPVLYIHRIADGKIQEAWLDWDALLSLMQQLGAVTYSFSRQFLGNRLG